MDTREREIEREGRYVEETPRHELIDPETSTRLRGDWNELKLRFVDDPESAVRDAERLVREAVNTVTETLRRECDEIGAGGKLKKASTEELRERFQHYESLLERLAVRRVH